MKIVVANGSALLRGGVAKLVERRGHEVIAMVDTVHGLATDIDDRFGDTDELPDLMIIDVRVPPRMSDNGLWTTVELRERYPQPNAMVLSQYAAPAYARELFSSSGAGGSAGAGTEAGSSGSSSDDGTRYLLKDRVGQVLDFLGSLEVVTGGGMVIDPDVATVLMQSSKLGLTSLTAHEREVLEPMTRGKPNRQVVDDLVLSGAAAAKHVSSIFMKLHPEPREENRHVRTTSEFLTAMSGQIQDRQQSHLSQRR